MLSLENPLTIGENWLDGSEESQEIEKGTHFKLQNSQEYVSRWMNLSITTDSSQVTAMVTSVEKLNSYGVG